MKRAALYVRVSTDKQTVEHQIESLRSVAERRGWQIVETYNDAGISGAKGRDKRPGLDRMLKDASKRRFDVVMAWAIDRLGRSLVDLLGTIGHLEAAGVDLYLDQQNIDTTSPMGKLIFQVTGAFAEFERTMIRQRVDAGLRTVKATIARDGKFVSRKSGIVRSRLGRPGLPDDVVQRVRDELAKGTGMLKVARIVGVGSGTVQKIKRGLYNGAKRAIVPAARVPVASVKPATADEPPIDPAAMSDAELREAMSALRDTRSKDGRATFKRLGAEFHRRAFEKMRRVPEEEIKRLKAEAADSHPDRGANSAEFRAKHKAWKDREVANKRKTKEQIEWEAKGRAAREKRSAAAKAAHARRKAAL